MNNVTGLQLLFDGTKSDPLDRDFDIYFGNNFNCDVVDDTFHVKIPSEACKRVYGGRVYISVLDFSLCATGMPGNANFAFACPYPTSVFIMCENISKPPGNDMPRILAQIPANYSRDDLSPLGLAGQGPITHSIGAQKEYREATSECLITDMIRSEEGEKFIFWFSTTSLGAAITTKITAAQMLWMQCHIKLRTTNFV